jgi:hypothetical protein
MRLVSDARHWWRWWSLRILAAAAALQAEIVLYPDALKGWLPDQWMHSIALGLLLIGAGARLVRQERPGD